jgi:Uma2 family endonuclease
MYSERAQPGAYSRRRRLRCVSDAATQLLTFDEFLEFEERAEVRHEFVGGQVFAMAGGTRRHNAIAMNAVVAIRPVGIAAGCQTYSNDVLVKVGEDAYYPDVMVVCGSSDSPKWEDAPCLIIEVLSPSTATIDRREKLRAYRSIPSLQAYLIVHPDSLDVDVHRRIESKWTHSTVGPGQTVMLSCPSMVLSIDDLFADTPA